MKKFVGLVFMFFMLVSCGNDYKKYEEVQKEIVNINKVISEYRNQSIEQVIRREPMVFFQTNFEEFKKIKLEKMEFPELKIERNQLDEISKKIEYLKKNLSIDEKTLVEQGSSEAFYKKNFNVYLRLELIKSFENMMKSFYEVYSQKDAGEQLKLSKNMKEYNTIHDKYINSIYLNVDGKLKDNEISLILIKENYKDYNKFESRMFELFNENIKSTKINF